MAIHTVHSGYAGGLGIAKETVLNTAVTPPTSFLEIASETFDNVRNWIDTSGIDGTRTRSKHRSAETTQDPRGGFKLDGLKGGDLDLLLELLLGNYGSGTGYVGDALPSFTAVVKKTPKYDVYSGCKMAAGTFEASEENQALQFDAEILAMLYAAGNSASFGTASYVNETPLVFARSTFTVAGESVRVKRWNMRVANALDEAGHRNSQTRICLNEIGEREVGGDLVVDWNADNYTKIMDLWEAGTYAELRAEFTNGVHRVTFVCPNCRYPAERGKIAGKGTMEMPARYEARGSAPAQRDELYIYVADV